MRTKSFERETVLKQAVYIFWRQGYDGTSMSTLVNEMGINRQSMYDTFGDKHQLFLLALQAYYEMTKTEIKTKLTSAADLEDALRTIFNVYAHHADTAPAGCLIVNSATELGAVDSEVGQLIGQYFKSEKVGLTEVLRQFQSELLPDVDLSVLAAILHNALVGVRVQSRINNQLIDAVINDTIQSLPWKEGKS
ncbi:MAG TPA: TetR/AcrR family transcriptional regulator [Lactobacillus sp.]|nr:TetR/AcrR family transcriptional regulator [Lactobacillus sp.]